MKNKKWILIGICMLMMLVLFGCKKMDPITIDTQMQMNRQFNGQRTMTTTIPQTAVTKLFNDDLELLKETIEKYIPNEMAFEVISETQPITINFMIPFANQSDYKTKVFRILSSEANPHKDEINASVFFDYSNTMLKHGFAYEEYFSTLDLFYWLEEGLKKEFPSVDFEQMPQICQIGQNKLLFMDNQIDCQGEYIKYTDISSTAFKSIEVTTDLLEDTNGFKGTVTMIMDRSNYDLLDSSKLNAKMKACVSADITYSTRLVNNEKMYIYTFFAKSENEYEEFLNRIFDSDQSCFEVIEEQNENETFKAQKKVKIYVDADYFIDFSKSGSFLTYVFNVDSKYRLDSVMGDGGFIQNSTAQSNDHLMTVRIENNYSEQITAFLGTNIDLQKVCVDTIVNTSKDYERKIHLYLPKEKEKLIGQNLTELIEQRLTSQMSFERGDELSKDIDYIITIKAASPEELSKLTSSFLDGTGYSLNSELVGGFNEENELRTVEMKYSDKIDFTQFLNGSDITEGIFYSLTFPKRFKASFVDAAEYEQVVEENNILSCVTKNKSISIQSVAHKTNLSGVILLCMFYLSLLLILILLLINLPGLIGCIKSKVFDPEKMGFYTSKGYIQLTVFVMSIILLIISLIRFIFKVY